MKDDVLKDACLMQLMVLGENAAHVPDVVKMRFRQVDWKAVKATRNFFAHAYNRVDWTLVWNMIDHDIPGFKAEIEHIIEVLEKEENGKTN